MVSYAVRQHGVLANLMSVADLTLLPVFFVNTGQGRLSPMDTVRKLSPSMSNASHVKLRQVGDGHQSLFPMTILVSLKYCPLKSWKLTPPAEKKYYTVWAKSSIYVGAPDKEIE